MDHLSMSLFPEILHWNLTFVQSRLHFFLFFVILSSGLSLKKFLFLLVEPFFSLVVVPLKQLRVILKHVLTVVSLYSRFENDSHHFVIEIFTNNGKGLRTIQQ